MREFVPEKSCFTLGTHDASGKKQFMRENKYQNQETKTGNQMPKMIGLASNMFLMVTHFVSKKSIIEAYFWTLRDFLAGIHQNVRGIQAPKNIPDKRQPTHSRG